ncbi:MAG: hypothetical protein Q9217_001153, partial [Psora testacea]
MSTLNTLHLTSKGTPDASNDVAPPPPPPQQQQQQQRRGPSPTAPPYSPITPEMASALPPTGTAPIRSPNPPNNPPPAKQSTLSRAPSSTKRSPLQIAQDHRLEAHLKPPTQGPTRPSQPQLNPPQPTPPLFPQPHLNTPLQTPTQPPQPHMNQSRPTPPQQPAQPPPPEPISESTNADAIALRAAMSILQMQRQQAIRDMQALEKQKKSALGDVRGFVEAVKRGDVSGSEGGGGLRFTDDGGEAGDGEEMMIEERQERDRDDGDDDDDDDDTMDLTTDAAFASTIQVPPQQKQQQQQHTRSSGHIPTPQNVVRMPPINWAKYHVIGEGLERLHEKQRKAPTDGRPRTDEDLRREME